MTAPTLEFVKPIMEVVEYYRSSGTQSLIPDSSTLLLSDEVSVAGAEKASSGTTSITSEHYSRLLDSIRALKAQEEADDAPTEFATTLAGDVLAGAAENLALNFPGAYVTVGPAGSLRISWSDRGKQVRLICGGSAQNKTYIYLEHGRRHGVAEKVTGDGLASSLRWMMAS